MYEPNPDLNESARIHETDDLNLGPLSHHHSIGEGPNEAISLSIAKRYFDLRSAPTVTVLEQFDPVFAPNLGAYPGFGQVRYFKDLSGIVHIKGIVGATGSVPVFTTLFTLPVGYRPYDQIFFPTLVTGNALNRVDILPTGEVFCSANLVNTDWVNFNGISFLAEN